MRKLSLILIITSFIFFHSNILARGVWTITTVQDDLNLYDIDVFEDGTCWIAADEGKVLHFDGEQWTTYEIGITSNWNTIKAKNNSDVWVGTIEGYLAHFDGSQWTLSQIETDNFTIADIELDSQGNFWLCGNSVFTGSKVMKYENNEWVEIFSHSSTFASFAVIDDNNIWVCGPNDFVLNYRNGQKYFYPTGIRESKMDIAVVDNSVFVLGVNYADGKRHIHKLKIGVYNWELLYDWWGNYLVDFDFYDVNHAIAVGNSGSTLYWDGFQWTENELNLTDNIYSIEFIDASIAIAVGSNGLFIKYSEPIISIDTNQDVYYAGDQFELTYQIDNSNKSGTNADLYIVLDVWGNYYFYPTWSEDISYENIDIPEDTIIEKTILNFTWPEGAGEGNDIKFYIALCEPDTYNLLTDFDSCSFSFR